jgi:hypothetical protein
MDVPKGSGSTDELGDRGQQVIGVFGEAKVEQLFRINP